jgi:hypothetical protein
MKRCLILAATALLLAAPAQALELGIQDAGAPLDQRNDWAVQTGAHWERVIAYIGEPGVTEHIRASHAAGRQVILTVGGLGTRTRRPNFTRALRYIATLPRAERYTISNEPDEDGVAACTYRRGWLKARRILGRRLLWGDLSPLGGLRFTLAARKCGHLPQPLDFAAHPYQTTDPLAPGQWELGMGSLPRARRTLAQSGVRVRWWLTEFGYGPDYAGSSIDDDRAAWLWPRALQMARHVRANVLVIYTAQGPSWNTRPGVLAWDAIRVAATI